MKKALLSAIVLSLSTVAFAEYQIDIDPLTLGETLDDHVVLDCVADIGFAAGMTFYGDNNVSGPSGFPERWHVVFQLDEVITAATPFNSMVLFVACPDGEGAVSSSITFAPYSVWYLPGPANPPAADSVFPAVALDCGGVITDAQDDMPTSFALNNAFPNPFNPSTSISFALPSAEQVSLTVFNIAGQEVASLANGLMEAGNHSLTFDAAQLGSGVYLYTLQAGSFTETKKMVLVK